MYKWTIKHDKTFPKLFMSENEQKATQGKFEDLKPEGQRKEIQKLIEEAGKEKSEEKRKPMIDAIEMRLQILNQRQAQENMKVTNDIQEKLASLRTNAPRAQAAPEETKTESNKMKEKALFDARKSAGDKLFGGKNIGGTQHQNYWSTWFGSPYNNELQAQFDSAQGKWLVGMGSLEGKEPGKCRVTNPPKWTRFSSRSQLIFNNMQVAGTMMWNDKAVAKKYNDVFIRLDEINNETDAARLETPASPNLRK
jgi:hypothetical protein